MGWALGYFYGNLGWDWGYLYGNFTSANKGLLCGHDSIGYGPVTRPWLWSMWRSTASL